MIQPNPEHERYAHRVGFACILGMLAVVLEFGSFFFRYSVGLPNWLWLLPFIGAFALSAVAAALFVTIARELRRQMPN